MNKVLAGLLACSALSTSVLANSDIPAPQNDSSSDLTQTNKTDNKGLYVGVEYFNGESSYEASFSDHRIESQDIDVDQDGFRVKFGAQLPNNLRVQGYVKKEEIEDDSNAIYGFGAEFLKIFAVNNKILPFVKGGVGLDWTDLETDGTVYLSEDEIYGYGLKVGAGAMYKVTNTLELVGGLDLQYRRWQDIEIYQLSRNITIEQNDTSITLYAGVNFHF